VKLTAEKLPVDNDRSGIERCVALLTAVNVSVRIALDIHGLIELFASDAVIVAIVLGIVVDKSAALERVSKKNIFGSSLRGVFVGARRVRPAALSYGLIARDWRPTAFGL
jgi:hypothetical protein